MLKRIFHKRNELQEVESFEDEECTRDFDFKDVKNLYIELKDGDITPLTCFKNRIMQAMWDAEDKAWEILKHKNNYEDIQRTDDHEVINELDKLSPRYNLYIPYISDSVDHFILYDFSRRIGCNKIVTLNDIAPNLSKYMPKDNAVLFLSEEDSYNYDRSFSNLARFSIAENDDGFYKGCSESGNRIYYEKLTIFLPHGTQSELQKANEIAKELKEKHGIEEVNLFVLHNFLPRVTEYYIDSYLPSHNMAEINIAKQSMDALYVTTRYGYTDFYGEWEHGFSYKFSAEYVDKIITTNSTGILELQNYERLQVIDCLDIFQDYLKSL